MQFLTILVATLLGACALIFVLYPIYERMRQVRGGQGNDGRQSNHSGQGSDMGQGDRKGRPHHTRNGKPDRNIVGVGLAPTLKGPPTLNGTPTLKGSPIANGTPTLENSLVQSTDTQAEREQTARTALQEVELDFQLGNLAETDYRSLRERYMRRALSAMKSRHDREQELDEAIEEQLRRMRETDEAHQSIEHNEHE